MNTTTLQPWGNSQGIRLTKDILTEAGISVGDILQISNKGKVITIKPKSIALEKMTLDDVLNTMPKDYTIKESFRESVGNEVW